MDQLADILKQRSRSPQEPHEIAAIKEYIDEHFHAHASVGIQNGTIIISVESASLANALRLQLPQLRSAAQTTRKLMFHIGGR